MVKNSWYLYIIECEGGYLYTGITTDVERRFREHQGLEGKNKGAKFFRTRKALRVGYVEEHEDRSAASRRESEIKKMTASIKRGLLKTDG